MELLKSADSRLQIIQVSDPSGLNERTFCICCGKPQGWVSKDSSQLVAPAHVVVTCDDCDMRLGALPLEKVPTDLLDAFGIIPEKAGRNVLV